MGVALVFGQLDILKTYVGLQSLPSPNDYYIALLSKIQNVGVGSAVDPTSTEVNIATVASSSSNLTEDGDVGSGGVDANYVRTAYANGSSGVNWTATLGSSGNPSQIVNVNAITITVPTGGLTNIVGWALCRSSVIGTADAICAGAFAAAQQGSYLAGESLSIAAGAMVITAQDKSVAN